MAVIVEAVMPAFLRLTQTMIDAVTWLQKNEREAKILVIALGSLATALVAARVAQLLLNLAVLANPYVAAGAAIIVFTALIMILWRRFEDARDAIVLFVARFSPLAALFLLVKNRGDELADMFRKFKETPAMEGMTKVFRAWGNALEAVVGFLGKVWDLVSKIARRSLTCLVCRGGAATRKTRR